MTIEPIISETSLKTMVNSYLDAALYATYVDESSDDETFDDLEYTHEDVNAESYNEAKSICKEFIIKALNEDANIIKDSTLDYEDLGAALYNTQNGLCESFMTMSDIYEKLPDKIARVFDRIAMDIPGLGPCYLQDDNTITF